jgi:hypothetical protein
MEEESNNPAAVELGKRGGKKTAERGADYYAAIQAKRQTKAGGRPKNPPKAAYEGKLAIADIEIDCAVLDDGTRVLSQRGVGRALGRKHGGGDFRRGGGELPIYLGASNLKPFISSELEAVVSKPIVYRGAAYVAHGIPASSLPDICDVWLKARDAGVLKANQLSIAAKADILIRALAGVAMVALVDEATGYQAIRDRDALQQILDRFLRKELAAWAKRFPDEFYQQMFRLRGWEWKGMKVNRPQVVGKYTNDLVWERLAPGIRAELESRNPKNDRGRRATAHHQWLTEDIGNPALAQHLYALIGLMRVSESGDWDGFYRFVQKAYPKKGETLFLPMPDSKR